MTAHADVVATLPFRDVVSGATSSGAFGDVNFSTSTLTGLFVVNGTIEAGARDSTSVPCFAGAISGSHVLHGLWSLAPSSPWPVGCWHWQPGAAQVDFTQFGGEPKNMKNTLALFATVALCAAAPIMNAQVVHWSLNGPAPVQSTIAGGPWTLSQGANPDTTYCTMGGTGVPIVNPLTTVNLMNPYYFPFVTGSGNNLQGYFDYRPDSINEATVAANSTDGGQTWTFQQEVASLSSDCPTSNPAAGNDDGEGHPHTLSFFGTTWLYLLDRRNDYVDNAGLIVQRLTPSGGQPLTPVAAGTTFTPPTSLPPGVSLFTGWNFNNDSNTSVTFSNISGSPSFTINNSPAPSIGAGTATPLGMTNNYTYAGFSPAAADVVGSNAGSDITTTEGSTDPNSDFTSNSWRVRGLTNNGGAPAGEGNGWNTAAPEYSQGVEFDVPTTGQHHVVMQYDWYVTAQGFRDLQAQYNLNINNPNGWTNVGPIQVTPDGGGFVDQITIDFWAHGIFGADNNPNFGVRLVGAYDPTYTGPGAPTYTGASLTNGQPTVYNNNSGNWRFDEVNFFGNNSPFNFISPISTVTPTRTTGLLNPDGILAVVPGSFPPTVLYVQKQIEGDYSFPTSEQCAAPPVVPPDYPYTLSANHDIATVRLAFTIDGINFIDLGPVTGLNDPTTVSYSGIRYVSPNGSLVKLPGGKWGLFFGAGNCIDGDSDSFHAIAYAESSDLFHWTVYNGINNPIASRPTATFTDQATGALLTIPAVAPLVGTTQAWFSGRVYAPNAIVNSTGTGVTLIFDGYDQGYAAKKSNNPSKMPKDLSSYRNIGQVSLSSGGVTLP